jgi:hypothetical protein
MRSFRSSGDRHHSFEVMVPVTEILSAENNVYPGENQPKLRPRQPPDPIGKQRLVQGHDLGNVCNRILGEAGNTGRKQYISWGISPFDIACKGNTDNRTYSASVKRVSLNNHNRPAKSRARARRIRKICPPNISLRDHHSICSRMRRDAAETNGSDSIPSSAQTLSIASVTRSGT